MIGRHGQRDSLAQAERQGAYVGEMQRRRLLLAMSELLAEDGIEGATVGCVCRRAGVSRRTFYEVFDDLEACFLAACEQAIDGVTQAVGPAFAAERGWSARVRAGVLAILEYFDEHPDVARICVVEMLRAGPEVLERRKRVVSALTALVDEGQSVSRRGGGPLPLAAEGVVGGALAVIHTRLSEAHHLPLVELANPLTGMILQSYLGAQVARRELDRQLPRRDGTSSDGLRDPFQGLSIRFTYRTARVLATIADEPGASNRLIADNSGIGDEGQMSRLLRRLETAALVVNRGEGHAKGEPNAWWLTPRGEAIHTTLAGAQAP